jgi:uncharacterized phiE125 gp8 family phage protein
MIVRQLTVPAWEAATLDEAKLWCRVDDDDTTQDAMLLMLIAAAREKVEDITGLALVERTFEVQLDEFPKGDAPILLPYPPLQSVDYLRYATADGDEEIDVGSPTSIIVDSASKPARVSPLYAESWPAAQKQPGSVRLGYTAGYTHSNAIPRRARLWIQQRVSTWFDNREHLVGGNMKDLPRDFVDGLLDDLRYREFFA